MLKTLLSDAGIRGQSLVSELKSRVLRGVAKKKRPRAASEQGAMLLCSAVAGGPSCGFGDSRESAVTTGQLCF